jgi:outer membrane lipoprotein-sorting protein
MFGDDDPLCPCPVRLGRRVAAADAGGGGCRGARAGAAEPAGQCAIAAHRQQVAGNGAVSTGRVWVSRPGRMRFEYERPNTLALLADSGFVYQWDKELQQTTKVELRSTPAWFILRDPVTFGPDVIVTRFEQGGGTVRVTVVEAANPDLGSLTLVFTENPLALRQWTVVDQQGRRTAVTLSDVQLGVALDPRLFQYQYLFSPPTQ